MVSGNGGLQAGDQSSEAGNHIGGIPGANSLPGIDGLPDTEGLPTIDGFADFTLIGRGGTSKVYSATETSLHRRVAIKVVSGDAEAASRLEREVRALGILDQVPYVVSAHAVVRTSDGHPALIMPLFRTSLAQLVRAQGPQPMDRVCEWAVQLAMGLDSAHAHGVVHRDVKPENVLLDDSGRAHWADFGIASLETVVSGTNTVMSLSPPHAPPERLDGTSNGDISGDVYSFASTLYLAITGLRAFGSTKSGGAAGLISRIVNEPVPHHDRLTPAVFEVLCRAMSKTPEGRYSTAGQLAAALINAARLDTGGFSSSKDRSTIFVADPTSIDLDDLTHHSLGRDGISDSWSGPREGRFVYDHGSGASPLGDGSSGLSGAVSQPIGSEPIGSEKAVDAERTPDSGAGRKRTLVVASAAAALLCLIVAAVVVIGGRGSSDAAGVSTSLPPGAPTSLILKVRDATKTSDLPSDFSVAINGDVVDTSELRRGESVSVKVPKVFANSDEAELVVSLPERHEFTIRRYGKSEGDNRQVTIRIADHRVQVEGESRERGTASSPGTVRVERRRVGRLIDAVSARAAEADTPWTELFEAHSESDPVTYEEAVDVLNDGLVRTYTELLDELDEAVSTNAEAQNAISSWRNCLSSKLQAFQQTARFDAALSQQENDDKRVGAWADARNVCNAAESARSKLDLD